MPAPRRSLDPRRVLAPANPTGPPRGEAPGARSADADAGQRDGETYQPGDEQPAPHAAPGDEEPEHGSRQHRDLPEVLEGAAEGDRRSRDGADDGRPGAGEE